MTDAASERDALYAAGDPAYVDALRRCSDPEVLAAQAARWSADARPSARALLRAYLVDRPLNAFRHEVLIKRLFKAAEAAGDDEAMAWFLVALDRAIRRRPRVIHRRVAHVRGAEAARDLAGRWLAEGAESVRHWAVGPDRHVVVARVREAGWGVPHGRAMPRTGSRRTWGRLVGSRRYGFLELPEWVVRLGLARDEAIDPAAPPDSTPHLDRLGRFTLFSAATRHHLRRRAWRYVARLEPPRHVRAVARAAVLYEEPDVAAPPGLGPADLPPLLDRWGLVHALFGRHPALAARSNGWVARPGFDPDAPEPAPHQADAWLAEPGVLAEVAAAARSRLVRRWALALLDRVRAGGRGLPLDAVAALLRSPDEEVALWAADRVEEAAANAPAPPVAAAWRAVLDEAHPAAREAVARAVAARLDPAALPLADAVEIARMADPDLARRGLDAVRSRPAATLEELDALARLAESADDAVRAEALAWARPILEHAPESRPAWAAAWLAGRHADARAAGLAWLADDPRLVHDPAFWDGLAGTPHLDVRRALVARLDDDEAADAPARRLPPETLARFWAATIGDAERGAAGAQRRAVAQVARRIGHRPGEAAALAPILEQAARSSHATVWRPALAALAALRARCPGASGGAAPPCAGLHGTG